MTISLAMSHHRACSRRPSGLSRSPLFADEVTLLVAICNHGLIWPENCAAQIEISECILPVGNDKVPENLAQGLLELKTMTINIAMSYNRAGVRSRLRKPNLQFDFLPLTEFDG